MSREIAFIDPNIAEFDTFVAGLRSELEAIVLSPQSSAPAQIADMLTDRSDLDAIHIVAHGAPGVIGFSSGALTIETLKGHAENVRKIGDALAPHGELLLWSCHTAQGERGKAFVGALEYMVGASVGAATCLIG